MLKCRPMEKIGYILILAVLFSLSALAVSSPSLADTVGPPGSILPMDAGLSLSYQDGHWDLLSVAVPFDFLGCGFQFGWVPLNWGPAPGDNLAFSPTRGHLMLYMTRDFGGMEVIPPFHWEQAYIFLEPRNGIDRYMVARRYRIEAGRWSLGYSEAALLTGEFSPWYLNPYPMIPLEVTQLVLQYLKAEGGRNDYCNMIMAVDARYQGERTAWYGSLFVDDMPPTSTWAIHYKVGIQGGMELEEPFGWAKTRLWLDYTAISRHTFSFYEEMPQGDYVDGDDLLGHPLGPDADLITARLTWTSSGSWVALQRERHGEGRFPDPHDVVTDQTFELLTGIVETAYWFKGGRSFALTDRLSVQLELGAAYVLNLDNVLDATGTRFNLAAQMAYTF